MALEPGCFGIALCHEPEGETCRSCPVRDRCAVIAAREALQVARAVGSQVFLKRFAKPKAPKQPLPKKVKEVADTLFVTGIDLEGSLAQGVNPMQHPSKLRYLHIACRLLLEGGFTRRQLIEVLRQELGWGETTAKSYASIALCLFKSQDVVVEHNRRFTLRRTQ